jgi:glycopeptide antibiotics resistance protein
LVHFVHFFPIPFIICLLVLAFAVWFNRRRGWAYLLGLVIFGLYIMTVIYMMYFPFPIPGNWPANLNRREILRSLTDVNLIPFNFTAAFGSRRPFLEGMVDVILNVILTVPLGMGICYLIRPRWWKILLIALATGLAFEGSQLFFKTILGIFFHAVDITDVITNAVGVLVGAGVYQSAAAGVRLFTKTDRKRIEPSR